MTIRDLCELIERILGLPLVEIIDSDFCYYDRDENVIGVNINDMIFAQDLFLDFIEQNVSEQAHETDIIVWSLLHEFGHYEEQFDTFGPNYFKSDRTLRQLIAYNDVVQEAAPAYFNLPREKYATEWAAQFINNNRTKCEQLTIMCKKWRNENGY